EVATKSTPIRTDVGFHQLVMGSPCALPTGTRLEAIAPTTVPSANGVKIDESAKTLSMARRPRAPSSWPRKGYEAPRRMIPTAATKSGTDSVDSMEPNARG